MRKRYQTSVCRLLPILGLFILLPASSVVSLCLAPSFDAKRNAAAGDQRRLTRHRQADSTNKFDCLPKDVRLNDVVSYGRGGKGNITVEKKLLETKARCWDGKLVDAKNKEIRFFRSNCWGSPPRDYLENGKQAFATSFVQRSRFTTALPTTMSPAQFVDKLFLNAGVTPTASDRTSAINEFNGAAHYGQARTASSSLNQGGLSWKRMSWQPKRLANPATHLMEMRVAARFGINGRLQQMGA